MSEPTLFSEVLVSSCVNELQKLMAFDHIGHVLLGRALTW